jgi:hypothetical protein
MTEAAVPIAQTTSPLQWRAFFFLALATRSRAQPSFLQPLA